MPAHKVPLAPQKTPPDLWICVADPFRPDAQTSYYPGDVNFRRADVIVVNKANTAPKEGVLAVVKAAHALNPAAKVICTSRCALD
jgi:predicted GTPase